MRKRVILCVAVVLFGNAWWSATQAQQSTTFSDADLQFMAQAAGGGAGEIELGRLAAGRAANEAVRRFGQRMVSDHGAANAQLHTLARQKGVILPPGPGPQFGAIYDRLASLPGGDFDRAYIVAMVNDHDRDVKEFEAASQMAQDLDLRTWAITMLPVLREHQRLARQLGGLRAEPAPAALAAAVVIVPPVPEPLWCGGAWKLTGGSNFTNCPR